MRQTPEIDGLAAIIGESREDVLQEVITARGGRPVSDRKVVQLYALEAAAERLGHPVRRQRRGFEKLFTPDGGTCLVRYNFRDDDGRIWTNHLVAVQGMVTSFDGPPWPLERFLRFVSGHITAALIVR